MAPVVAFPISQECLPLLDRAWDEVKNNVSNEPPTEGSLVLFDPSKTCKVLIDWVHGEIASKDDSAKGSYSKSWGYRFFPEISIIGGETSWAVIPLDIVGEAKIGDVSLRRGTYYRIPQRSLLGVSGNGRLTGLVLWS